MIKKKDNKVFGFILFYTLCSIYLFYPLLFDFSDALKYLYAILNILIIPSVLTIFFKRNNRLFLLQPVRVITVTILISIFSSYVFRGQPLYYSFLASLYPFGAYTLYFFLISKRVKIEVIEQIILIMGILSLVCFYISFIVFPSQIFKNAYENVDFSRGFQRIQLFGFGYLYLLFFMALNKIRFKAEKKKWIIITLISFLAIILSLTRTYIVFSAVIAIFYLLSNSKLYFKVIVICSILYLGFIVPQLDFAQKLISSTNEDLSNVKDYIRFQGAVYYLNDFQKSWFTQIFGSGFPYGDKSEYGRQVIRLEKEQYFYVSDLGLLGLYIYTGIFSILAYAVIFYRSFNASLKSDMVYLKMFLWFILLIGLNSYATFNPSFLTCIVFVFYLLEVSRVQVLGNIADNLKNQK